jgi:hypothetical protein
VQSPERRPFLPLSAPFPAERGHGSSGAWCTTARIFSVSNPSSVYAWNCAPSATMCALSPGKPAKSCAGLPVPSLGCIARHSVDAFVTHSALSVRATSTLRPVFMCTETGWTPAASNRRTLAMLGTVAASDRALAPSTCGDTPNSSSLCNTSVLYPAEYTNSWHRIDKIRGSSNLPSGGPVPAAWDTPDRRNGNFRQIGVVTVTGIGRWIVSSNSGILA